MTWAKVDDTLHSHPKARKAGLPALGLHLLAMSYCGQYLTDGFVEDGWIDMHVRTAAERKLPGVLVDAGLWHEGEGGYWIHDWLVYNPSREYVESKRAERSKAGKAGADARWHSESNGNSHG
jgi:hypothetical protein